MTTKACLEARRCRLGERTALLEMGEHTFVELDWRMAAHVASDFGYHPPTTWGKGEEGSAAWRGKATLALGAAAVLTLGVLVGRLTAKL